MSDVIMGGAAAGGAGASAAAAPDGNGLGPAASAAEPMSGSAGMAGGVPVGAGAPSAASELGRAAAAVAPTSEVVLETRDVNVFYGDNHVLHNTSLAFHKGEICALIGPSGCGKSTFLRSLNLMNREIRGCRVEGEILYGGRNINTHEENLYELRRSIGMVFQQPNPFRKTIYENIVFAPKRHGLRGKDNLDALVEESLRAAALWDEVKDKLHQSAFSLSGGQQQRLCIARTLAMHPDVILFDEPCSALDPISTIAIEELMQSVVKDRAIVIVTHNMEQASRVSNRTAFFYMGDMVECGETDQIFQRPRDKRLNDYLTGMFS